MRVCYISLAWRSCGGVGEVPVHDPNDPPLIVCCGPLTPARRSYLVLLYAPTTPVPISVKIDTPVKRTVPYGAARLSRSEFSEFLCEYLVCPKNHLIKILQEKK